MITLPYTHFLSLSRLNHTCIRNTKQCLKMPPNIILLSNVCQFLVSNIGIEGHIITKDQRVYFGSTIIGLNKQNEQLNVEKEFANDHSSNMHD